jgi:hypothetical protein
MSGEKKHTDIRALAKEAGNSLTPPELPVHQISGAYPS